MSNDQACFPELAADQLRIIIDAQAALASVSFDLQAFLKIAVVKMQTMTHATGATIELVEDDEMVYRAASGSIASFDGMRIKRKGSLSGLCIEHAEIKTSPDTAQDPRVNAEACRKVGAASMIVVPLFGFGQPVGVLKVVSDKTFSFNDSHTQMLQLMASLLGSALAQQLEAVRRDSEAEKLKHQAQYDSLTGLPNRALFRDRITHAVNHSVRDKKLIALMYIDLDHFKPVNDTYGHDAGDALLKSFSARIKALVRETDTFARLGGDEFTLVLEGVRGMADVERIAKTIGEAAREEFDLGRQKVKVSASIGIAACPGVKIDVDDLIKQADSALYVTKQKGRDGYTVFDAGKVAAR